LLTLFLNFTARASTGWICRWASRELKRMLYAVLDTELYGFTTD